MSIERLIESIGMDAPSLKRFLLSEIDEFLEAGEPVEKEEEFGDILFALMCMAWTHAGRHYALRSDAFEAKIRRRLRNYGTLSRQPRHYRDDRIPELEFGVLHLAFGQFAGQWANFDPLNNGTVAEIQLLTDAPFDKKETLTNHCIVTFGDTDNIEYDFRYASASTDGGNTVRCQIPDFMFKRAKRELKFAEFGDFLSMQVLAALDGLRLAPGTIVHFHSWEGGFLAESAEFRDYISACKTIFSPYLTTARLKCLVDESPFGNGWTMSDDEMAVSSAYERKLCIASMRVVVEGARDRDFYSRWVHPDRLDVRSFARDRSASYKCTLNGAKHLTFLAGGRPVREKGFLELCQEFGQVREWAASCGLTVSLSILCREQRRDKGAAYIEQMERIIAEASLDGLVTIEPKVSLETLRQRIAESTAVIAPSLYDPFCLMPTYAIEVQRPAFVSCYAGVSENIKSRQFTFDPGIDGDLRRAVATCYEEQPLFEFESCFPTYRDIYLSKEAPQPWE